MKKISLKKGLNKLFVVDLALTIDVSYFQKFINVLLIHVALGDDLKLDWRDVP
jgi:hypothetical protein